MITKDKVTEIFCIIDEFEKNLSVELSKNLHLTSPCNDGIRHRNRKGRMSESEIMTILVYYHFGTYRNFKEYYLNCILGQLRSYFPHAVSYNRFVELMPRVFYELMLLICIYSFGRCSGITFVDSTMIPVCITLGDISTKCLPVMQKMEKERWDGATASNCTSSTTTPERS